MRVQHGMQRKELEKALKGMGWRFLRHDGRHDVWTDGNRQEPIPRHIEINEKLALSILRKVRREGNDESFGKNL
jgi:mRNA interferase HicA